MRQPRDVARVLVGHPMRWDAAAPPARLECRTTQWFVPASLNLGSIIALPPNTLRRHVGTLAYWRTDLLLTLVSLRPHQANNTQNPQITVSCHADNQTSQPAYSERHGYG